MNPETDGWKIRPARDADFRAVRMLLPTVIQFASGAAVRVAVTMNDRVIGAVAMSPRFRADPVPGGRVALHVIPAWRRRGIGRSLLASLDDTIRPLGLEALYAWDAVEPESELAPLWHALGFVERTIVQLTRVEIDRATAHIAPVYDQLARRDWIPSNTTIAGLQAADVPEVVALHMRHLGGRLRDLQAIFSHAVKQVQDAALSPVLRVNEKVVAFTLVRLRRDGVCFVESTVVAPAFRGGWANLYLKYHGLRWAQAASATAIEFQTYARHSDTRKVARQMGGVTRELIEPYRRILPAGAVGEIR